VLSWSLRKLRLPLRTLFVLEDRPPIRSSASKENARKCLVHLFPCPFFDTSRVPLRLFLRARTKNSKRPRPTKTIGTAIAAFKPGEQDTLVQESSFATTPPSDVVDWAAAVPVAETPGVVWVVNVEDRSVIVVGIGELAETGELVEIGKLLEIGGLFVASDVADFTTVAEVDAGPLGLACEGVLADTGVSLVTVSVILEAGAALILAAAAAALAAGALLNEAIRLLRPAAPEDPDGAGCVKKSVGIELGIAVDGENVLNEGLMELGKENGGIDMKVSFVGSIRTTTTCEVL